MVIHKRCTATIFVSKYMNYMFMISFDILRARVAQRVR